MSKYGQHVRPRNWRIPRPPPKTLAATVAACLAAASLLTVVTDARRDVARAEQRITALEAQRERAEQDTEDLWDIVIGLQPPAKRAQTMPPRASETWYEAPDPNRTMPPPQPNRSRPRRTLLPMPSPSPAPQWRPVTPDAKPAAQSAQSEPSPSPTPSPTESAPCPAATVGDAPCVLEFLPVSESPSAP